MVAPESAGVCAGGPGPCRPTPRGRGTGPVRARRGGVWSEGSGVEANLRLVVSVAVLRGGARRRDPNGVARKFEQAIPDARLVVIPDCGHVSNLERPERFNEAVREFCRAHSPSET
jgi:pimeloyl-ACP methyl ester carboxylesterase